jgi:hypothetical protein
MEERGGGEPLLSFGILTKLNSPPIVRLPIGRFAGEILMKATNHVLQSSVFLLFLELSVAAALLAQPPAGPKALEVSFEERAVVVQGVTPHGRVAVFGVAREVAEDDVATILQREEVLLDEDGDGAVRWELDRAIPIRSAWAAVDLESGAHAAAAPEGLPLRQVPWGGRGPVAAEGGPDRVESSRRLAAIFLARPGQGAWSGMAGDGSPLDEDGVADGSLTMALDRLRPVAGGPEAPGRFDPRDVVWVIDPNTLELSVALAAGIR